MFGSEWLSSTGRDGKDIINMALGVLMDRYIDILILFTVRVEAIFA